VAVRIDIFPSRYRDVRHLARGGMGDVYRATDSALGRTVALKLLAERYADDEDIRRRFKNEALAAARLSNVPFTVTIFDVGEAEEQPFIVMELLEGGSLADRLRTGRPTTAETLGWLGQAARALDAGHELGVVHRDVKPGNLLLDARGDVHVADFGVASAVGLDSLTMTGTVLGTAGYLSPEQALGQRATPASDRYALAVVAWELLTGRRPFESESMTAEAASHVHAPVPPISADGLPPALDPVFRRALEKDPAARYPLSVDFVGDLREGLHQAAATTMRQDVLAPPARPVERRSRLIWVVPAVLAAMLLSGGLALAGVFGEGEPQTTTVVRSETITQPGTTVTTQVTTTAPATTATTAPTPAAPPAANGVELTDQATQLLREERWPEAEAAARQAVAALAGSGELYEAYANYDLGRALVEQGRCEEAVPYLDRSEEIQGNRKEIRDARRGCETDEE
jgi:eukaryotic-like serine/threonine-protein kinase